MTPEKKALRESTKRVHLEHWIEGYREKVLESTYGSKNIDSEKYSPDSARRYSYDEGRKQAEKDLKIN